MRRINDHGVPDSTRYYTERFGVDCCVIEMRSEYNIPCFVPARDGNMDFVKDVKSLNKNLPIYIKT